MSVLEEFKKFLMRGNILDLATAVLIGAAFNKIVTSLANDIISPVLGIIMGGINLSDKVTSIYGTNVVIKYGSFLQAVIDFLITATIIFLLIKLSTTMYEIAYKKQIRKEKKEEKAAEEKEKAEEKKQLEILKEIRDLLKKK